MSTNCAPLQLTCCGERDLMASQIYNKKSNKQQHTASKITKELKQKSRLGTVSNMITGDREGEGGGGGGGGGFNYFEFKLNI